MKVQILYTNYKGETAWRTITPKEIYFDRNEWHPTSQWLLLAFDENKKADRCSC